MSWGIIALLNLILLVLEYVLSDLHPIVGFVAPFATGIAAFWINPIIVLTAVLMLIFHFLIFVVREHIWRSLCRRRRARQTYDYYY